MKLKALPKNELPRERLCELGASKLSNEELLSIIFRTGVKDMSVKEVSTNLLSSINSIQDLANISIEELSSIKGVGLVKAVTLLASLELGKRVYSKKIENNILLNNTMLVHETFKNLFVSLLQEKFLVIYLNTKKELIGYDILFVGTLDSTSFHPREVLKGAIKRSASAIIVMHNHPSGNVNPSNNDILLTKQLMKSCALVGIPLLDHLITNGSNYYSFFDNGVIE